MWGTTTDIGQEATEILFSRKTHLYKPSFYLSHAYRDPTIPTTQYGGLCHVTIGSALSSSHFHNVIFHIFPLVPPLLFPLSFFALRLRRVLNPNRYMWVAIFVSVRTIKGRSIDATALDIEFDPQRCCLGRRQSDFALQAVVECRAIYPILLFFQIPIPF